MRALLPVLLVVTAALAGCSGAAGTAAPGIGPRTAVLPEERSTCEALARVDLAVVARDGGSLARASAALDDVVDRAPDDLRPAAESLAAAYAEAADAPVTAGALEDDTYRAAVLHWFNTRCGGMR
ncbi:MAG TPA: hypothetical protein VFU19_11175 [Iamia sp.]|nr:hypothetical protein [Iamia sp.]